MSRKISRKTALELARKARKRIDNLLKREVDRDAQVYDTAEPLWDWFELSYASFCVLPRVLMHAMSKDWQARMAELLEEWDETWDWSELPRITTRVQAVDPQTGRITRLPTWLKNYRYPDKAEIDNLKRKAGRDDKDQG